MRKQLFISHTWQPDEEGRDTHQRAKELADEMSALGWSVWFDEVDMANHIEAAMASGIDEADAVIILLTRAYARKINRSARSTTPSNDNCLKEFGYSLLRGKHIVPVVFEESMRYTQDWSPGVVPMRLASMLYVDGTADASITAWRIHEVLLKQKWVPDAIVRVPPILCDARRKGRGRITPLWPCGERHWTRRTKI